jgi:hypothetical protein
MGTYEVVMRQVERFGFSGNPVFDKLMSELAYLAGKWRTTKEDALIGRYQTILRTLVFIGYDEELPLELELPDELMPAEYLALFEAWCSASPGYSLLSHPCNSAKFVTGVQEALHLFVDHYSSGPV